MFHAEIHGFIEIHSTVDNVDKNRAFNHFSTKAAKLFHFSILHYLTPDDFSCQGRNVSRDRVKSYCISFFAIQFTVLF